VKVALLLFPISAEGGLTTKTLTFYEEMEARGHKVDFFRISYGSKHAVGYEKPFVKITKTGMALQHKWLSIADDYLGSTLSILNTYDRLVFLHPCPHLSDAGSKASANWQALYTATSPPKTVTFSDVYWDKYYPHIENVVGTFHALAVNSAVLKKTQEVCPDARLVHQVYKDPGKEVRENRARSLDVVWASAWRGWKGIARFLQSVAATELRCELFGTGREVFNLGDEIRALKASQKHFSQVHPDRVLQSFGNALAVADWTGRSPKYFGHYNRTTIEPILYGAVPLVMDTLVEPHSIVPAEACLVLPAKQTPEEAARQMVEALADGEALAVKASRAYEWYREHHNTDQALTRLLHLDG
jgi:hypothetical protein